MTRPNLHLCVAFALTATGLIGACAPAPAPKPNPRIDTSLVAPPGFDVEVVHAVDPEAEGSWVALCAGPGGTLYAADQQAALYRITPPALDDHESVARVDRVDIELKGAQGLLYAFDALYVMASGTGLLRVTDTDGDNEVDTSELLVEVHGAGEHGTHAIVLHPDGQSLLMVCGNHTPLPATLTGSRVPRVWAEDHLLPRDPDPRGHATGMMAPAGYICRVAPDGSEVELLTCGFRNSYDAAVSPAGDIFTFDADMEWDLGLPWYRPARICHAVSGADFGWRYGSGKWPDYYEDSLPSVIDIGPASPTGTLFGTGAAFPGAYQRALFALDWTYGIIYAIHLEPDGASYTGRAEQFITGKPLPLTDAAIGADGAMYFATGGRRLASKLYRVVYRGAEGTAPIAAPARRAGAAELRSRLEGLHGAPASPAYSDRIWAQLSNQDRFVRHAARVALEHQPVEWWRDRAIAETDPATGAQALIALARQSGTLDPTDLVAALLRLDPASVDEPRQLALLRAFALTLIRSPDPLDEATRARVIEHLGRFSTESASIDIEVARLMIGLGHAGVIDRCLRRMSDVDSGTPATWADLARQNDQYGGAINGMLDRPPPTRALRYAHMLSALKEGWTFQQRQAYFTLLQRAGASAGGMSYRGYVDAMRRRALEGCSEHERAALAPLLEPIESDGDDEPALVFPKGPWREWTVANATRATQDLNHRFFARGAGLYRASSCSSCHQLNGSGSNVGPDLSSVGSTYSVEDLVRAIIEPSHAITDQYAVSVVTKTNGERVSGLIVESDDTRVTVAPNFALADVTTEIPRAEVRSIELSPTSAMPAGLVNGLSEELRDLVAYLIAAGDPADPIFERD